jgi:hypothetical protein
MGGLFVSAAMRETAACGTASHSDVLVFRCTPRTCAAPLLGWRKRQQPGTLGVAARSAPGLGDHTGALE